MASDVKVTISGDSSSLEKAFSNVGSSAKEMASDLDSAEGKAKSFGGAMDAAGGAADASESKFMASADLLDGLGGAFGLPTEGATNLMRSFGDLSGGVAGLMPMVTGLGATIKGFATTLIAPPMGIILLIGAVAAALVVAYQKSETFRNIVQGAFDAVKGAVTGVWNFISSLPEKIAGLAGGIRDGLSGPFRAAFNFIARAWNNTAGRLKFTLPDWVPGLGGKGFSMPHLPEFHRGGTVPGTPGAEVPVMALAGETFLPPGGAGGVGGPIVVQLVLDGRVITEVVHNGLIAKQRRTPLGIAS